MSEIKLEYPVEVGGVPLDKINMRRPKVKDQLVAKKSSKSQDEIEVQLFANLCEVAPAVIENMDMKDYSKLQKEYRSFLS
ncbi:phage tail assembly protein [Desulfovibrio gilichinskyi]|uniref:Phage tail assembly chaperone protein, E, or 41 or 14 n=1 Tax=Desulfovibrio gilichinskyi TaxID=1519643 RepID=A0A1X7CH78_9BACT|nr:phage tail assembly protein [Desulfovibrio gilichinskyi]SME96299.1 Phage tail assembly chaperone protein, E, or 41 or 14 [Desulfovibrio gilichinskyi]